MHSLFEQIAAAVRPPKATLEDVIAWIDTEREFIKKTDNYDPSDYERGYSKGLKDAQDRLRQLKSEDK